MNNENSTPTPPPPAPMSAPQAQQIPAPQPVVAETPRKVSVISWIALGLAVIGFIIACVPGGILFGWLPLLAALILAIIGLVKQGRKWAPLIALVLSVVGGIVGIVTLFAGLAVAVNDAIDNSSGSSLEQPADAGSDEEAAAEGPEVTPLGSAAQSGNLAITVTKVQPGVPQVGEEIGGTLLGEVAQGQFVLVHVTVENTGSEGESFSDSGAKLYDAQQREFDANSTAAVYLDESNSLYSEINPGNTLQGVLVFDIPKDATIDHLEYQGMFAFGDDPAILALK